MATLVQRLGAGPGEGPRPALLYLHGWNDYFFQTHLADYWAALGYQFYALDLRRYGRSLRPGQLRGYIADLSDYADEIGLAIEAIRAEHEQIVLMGHSTGGLVAALWAAEHADLIAGLVLNSPWLDLQGAPLLKALGPLVDAVGARAGTSPLPMGEGGFYHRTLHVSGRGEWDYDTEWKSSPGPPVRAGWLRAILRGHAQVARGLGITVPVLVMCSARTSFRKTWHDELMRVDTVLDVEQIAARAPKLGRHVTLVRVDGGLHDLVLSSPPVRARVLVEMSRWGAAYLPHGARLPLDEPALDEGA